MDNYEKQVLECHQAMELDVASPYSVPLLRLREKLLTEELDELKVEIHTLMEELQTTGKTNPQTKARMYKELADLQYVLSGMVVALGIPMEEVFKRVHQSNMSKLVNGKVLKREDGKFLKGPNYKPPVLDDLVA
ncbi:MAG: hypothetical protein ACI4OW_05830 [Alphaproteobacteria bacterium]